MASTSVTFDSEVYAYSRAKGLFAGVSLEGNGIFIGKKANRSFYDGEDSAAAILASKQAPPPPADELLAEVRRITSSSAERTAEEAAAPAAEVTPPKPPAEPQTYPMADQDPGTEPPP
jgi:hypothetical protein